MAGRYREAVGAMGVVIAIDDPGAHDVRALLEAHLAFSWRVTPVGFAYALGAEDIGEPGVTFFGARLDGRLVGIGALRRIDGDHAELKSMHTREEARRHGVGRAMVDHLLAFAGQQGYRRVSLETGTVDAFAPARALYRSAGFRPCEAFGGYRPSPHNAFFTVTLGARGPEVRERTLTTGPAPSGADDIGSGEPR